MSRSLVIACLLLASSAWAQVADRPAVREGDRWSFVEYYAVPQTVPNRNWVITSVKEGEILGTENGEPLRMGADTNVFESPRNRMSNPRYLDFPLSVGKRWSFDSDWHFKPKGSSGRIAAEVVVAAYEKVRVVAGEFDAFRLEASERMAGNSPIGSVYDGTMVKRTYWYAPAARAIVRWESHNPYLGRSTVELVSAP